MGLWMSKFWVMQKVLRCMTPLGIEIMDACFQAPHCCTWTVTGGNALCSVMNFIFQHVTLARPYKVTYMNDTI